MEIHDVVRNIIAPAMSLLPPAFDSERARVMMLAIGLQESRFVYRRQINGPARGFWQFERGTKQSKGGVWGVYLHSASRPHLYRLCQARGVEFDPGVVYFAVEQDDILAAGVARLLLWTDPKPLPDIGDVGGAWALYERTWRPGRPHRNTWDRFYAQAVQTVLA